MKKTIKITDLLIARCTSETMVLERNKNIKILFSSNYKIFKKLIILLFYNYFNINEQLKDNYHYLKDVKYQ